jgi:acyl-homoserine-lactone acylase
VGTPRLPIAPVPADADGVDVDPLVRALAVAVQTLEGAGFAVDARLGDLQWRYLPDGSKVGVPGGSYGEGTIGIAYWDDAATTMLTGRQARPPLVNEASGLTTEGYAVNDGNSWILALELTEAGPRGRAVMTYSQSSRADSPHASDQAELFGAGALRPVRFDEADIAADVVEELTLQSP